MLIEPNQRIEIASGMHGSQMDDNKEIIRNLVWLYPFLDAIEARLAIGVETYGHGVRVNDDTTQWGTKKNSWLEMALEELDDLAIYVQADELRKVKFAREQGSLRYSGEAVAFREIVESLAQVRLKLMELLELVDDA